MLLKGILGASARTNIAERIGWHRLKVLEDGEAAVVATLLNAGDCRDASAGQKCFIPKIQLRG